MTHAGAACGVESLLAAEPMTPAQMHEGGIGPYAGRAVATAQTGGDGETREFETQTDYPRGGATPPAVAAQCPGDLSARRGASRRGARWRRWRRRGAGARPPYAARRRRRGS